ncbi:MAG: DUF1501 domain-containing protein, partial [Pirellulales bacterium]
MATIPPSDRSSLPSRRAALWQIGGGFASIALAQLLAREGLLAADPGAAPAGDLNGGLHHPAKIRRIVQLFMNGGASPMDTFDHKPRLAQLDGKAFDPGTGEKLESVTNSPGFKVLRSPFKFQRHGQSGRWVSEVFPHVAGIVDDLAFLMSMVSKSNVHGPASYMQNTGFVLPGFPCLGAWVSYALGNLTDNLPSFVVLPDARGLPYNNQGNFSSAFLPVKHQGTIIRPHLPNPIADLFPPKSAAYITPQSERASLALLDQLNRRHQAESQGDSRLEARIASYELAAKMQLSAPEVLDVGKETAATQRMYGLTEKETEPFGRKCLIARRMLERGVRFVQVWSGASGPTNNWDNHGNISTELPPMALSTDKPAAALVMDLKQRGLLKDTLVIWTTEFGRMPFSQGAAGRDHNAGTFVTWLAGAGIQGGVAHGQSDEWGWRAIAPIWCY